VFRSLRKRFKLRSEDKPRVNLKHLAYYILAWIIYIDNIYKSINYNIKRFRILIRGLEN
jgi:hypothetical protein